MLLHEYLKRDANKTKDVGIEIEVEGARLPNHMGDGDLGDIWIAEPDGSLRGGMEYIFNGAQRVKDVPKYIKMLNDYFTANRSQIKFSFRTSVHVHVNHLGCDMTQICNSIYTYMLLEPLLINFAGESRKGNRFCLRVADADGLLFTMKKMFSMASRGCAAIKMAVAEDENRYAAINIESLNKHGTIEIRCLRGTNDEKVISAWSRVLVNIRDWAMKQENPQAIYQYVQDKGVAAFIEDAMGPDFHHFMYYNCENDVQYYQSLSIDLPFSFNAAAKVNPAKVEINWGEAFAANVNEVLEVNNVIRGARVARAPGI